MRTLLRAALVLGTLGTPMVAFADTPAKADKADAPTKDDAKADTAKPKTDAKAAPKKTTKKTTKKTAKKPAAKAPAAK